MSRAEAQRPVRIGRQRRARIPSREELTDNIPKPNTGVIIRELVVGPSPPPEMDADDTVLKLDTEKVTDFEDRSEGTEKRKAHACGGLNEDLN